MQKLELSVEAAIAALDTPEERLAKAEELYKGFSIKGTKDKEGYETAKKGISALRTTRTTLEKKRKEIVQPAREYIESINDYAKKTTARIERLEEHLKLEVDKIDRAKELERQALIAERKAQLKEAGFGFDGTCFVSGDCIIHPSNIEEFDAEQWANTIDYGRREAQRIAELKAKEEAERKAKEEADRAERERLRKQAEDAEAARKEAEAKIAELQRQLEAAQPKPEPPAAAVVPPVVERTPNPPTPAAKPFVQPTSGTHTEPLPDEVPLVKRNPVSVTVFDYNNGFEDCRAQVLAKLADPAKFTRTELLDFVNALKPKK
jgi:hypothetical protein